MSDRYTSPALSRDLAAAGLAQAGMAFVWCFDCIGVANENDEHDTHLIPFDRDTCLDGRVRALDLTDVLAEIEACGATWLVETDGDTYCATAVLNPKFSAVMGGPTAAEAAGLCLLALLDKLREAKP